MRNSMNKRQKMIFRVVALIMLLTLTLSVTFNSVAQTPCQSYNDQGQCIAWGGAAGYSSYQSWLDWQEYFACVEEATAKNNDDEANDVDVDEECDEPDTPIISGSGGGTSSTAASD